MSSKTAELDQIAKLLDRAHPPVVVVVGAGVAVNATGKRHASWLGLLKHGVQHLVATNRFTATYASELETSLNAAFSPFQLGSALNHADTVERVLRTPNDGAFADWLETAFADFKCRPDDASTAQLDALRDLHEAGALLLTTNYDGLLHNATGAPVVTWEEHADFHRVMTRQKPGILHIHGHWLRPSSVVLGRSSYGRVVADTDFQQLLQTLWLENSWVYVGCGDGLDDPNLGRLLRWSKAWDKSAFPHFFFAREDKAKEINNRASKPSNLVAVGYSSHDQLAPALRSVCPAPRSWPFIAIDDDFPLFHIPGASDPFPTRQEYLDCAVPGLSADEELQRRLKLHSWASCIDVASVGKTTLALRVASKPEHRKHPAYYLDLKNLSLDDTGADCLAAAHRLTRPETLLILDNIHHKPELARRLWQQWRSTPSDSRGHLLLLGTQIHQPIVVKPDDDLAFFENHPTNPPVRLLITPETLGELAEHLHSRVAGTTRLKMPKPPPAVLQEWHSNYRAALNAFTFAVLDSLSDFQNGKWSLPPSRASAWVRKQWLERLDAYELANTLCLATFGAQELEMQVPNEALPHPGKLHKLFELGLVSQTHRGQFKQYKSFELREPGWGRLILAAQMSICDEDRILFDAATRHLMTACMLSLHFFHDGDEDRQRRLWEYVGSKANDVIEQMHGFPVSYLDSLMRGAAAAGQTGFLDQIWTAIVTEPSVFAAGARAAPVAWVAAFFVVAKQQQRETVLLWDALVGKREDPDQSEKVGKFVAWTRASALDSVGSFLAV
ncbi:MAG TPA: SIR2 family protein, partial [Reyranella sp.]|nr:SIR2 family protein [Reyranella sp.]